MQIAGQSKWIFVASALFFACGERESSGLPLPRAPRPAALRRAEDLEVLSHWISQNRAAQLDVPVRESARTLLDSIPAEKNWVQLDDWALRRTELAAVDAWAGQVGTARTNVAIDVLRHYVEQLEQAGIELLIVPVPSRLHVDADRLPGCAADPEPLAFDAPFLEALRAISAAGIEVLPLIDGFARERVAPDHPSGERLFLDYNRHWTPRGVTLAADLIAERVRQMKSYERGPFRQGEDYDVRREVVSFREPSSLRQAHEPRELLMERVLDGAGEPVKARDHRGSIVVLGDSFASFFSEHGGDLVRLLFARLGHRIDLIGLAGSEGSNWNALARRKDPLGGKLIVLWVFNHSALGGSRFRKVQLRVD